MNKLSCMSQEYQEIRSQLEKEMPMKGVPIKAQNLVWALAWEYGHAGGDDMIALHYDDLRAVALLASGVRKE